MSLRFRRSVGLFPGVRLNFSRSGVSTTVGMRGASLTLGGRGAHLNLGLSGTGLSYRTRIAPPKADIGSAAVAPMSAPALQEPEIVAQDIRSEGVEDLTSPGLAALKQLIEAALERRQLLTSEVAVTRQILAQAQRTLAFARTFVIRIFTADWRVALEAEAEASASKLRSSLAALDACFVEVDFAIDPAGLATHAALVRAFEGLAGCEAAWDLTASTPTNRAAMRTAAFEALSRTRVSFDIAGVGILKTTHPVLRLGEAEGRDIHLYPGFLMMRGAGQDFALLEYRDLDVAFRAVSFIEAEAVPADAQLLGQTWAKANKDGSQDLRFRDNHPLPIVRYGQLTLSSPTGLREAFMFSDYRAMRDFAKALEHHRRALADQAPPSDLSPEGVDPPPTDDEGPEGADLLVPTPAPGPDRPRSLYLLDWSALAMILLGLAYLGGRLEQALARPQPPPAAAAPPAPARIENPVRAAQAALAARGYQPGPVDGVMGRRTREALRAFQAKSGLPVTGNPDQLTLDRLGATP